MFFQSGFRCFGKPLFVLVIEMDTKDQHKSDGRAAAMALLLPQRWRQEIEKAVDRVKNAGKRTPNDQWFRRAWYKQQWRMREVKGPRIERD